MSDHETVMAIYEFNFYERDSQEKYGETRYIRVVEEAESDAEALKAARTKYPESTHLRVIGVAPDGKHIVGGPHG